MGRSLLQGLASTPRRRGVPFTRVRRRGLRSMSGHPAYAWGNPPTLRRSSFPQRALRPARGPIPKHAWGCAPRPPNAQAAAGYALKVPAAHFILDSAGTELKQTPYKRRRVGRNLRLSRADPALCSGQPSPLRCILLSPQGLTTLRGPRLYGAYRRVGVSGSSPSVFCLLLHKQK